ncbi:MAG: nucleotidyltransferase domain-containing protein [Prolixibacteraceae bacterium]
MRLSPDIASFLKQTILGIIPGSTVYLFGSRTDDNAKGGDIDLLILTEELVAKNTIRKIRVAFIKKFGWRKLDLVNLTHSNDSSFRKLINSECIPL